MNAIELAQEIYEAIMSSGVTGINEGAFIPVVADMIRQREGGWISVEERLPELTINSVTNSPNGEGFSNSILVWVKDEFSEYVDIASYQYRDGDSKWLISDDEDWYAHLTITHW